MSRRPPHWLAALAVVATFSRCGGGATAAPEPAPSVITADLGFDAQRAYGHVATQVGFGPRTVGSAGSRATIVWLNETLRAAGWRVVQQPFAANGTAATNVFAHAGTGPAVIVGAHFDTRLVADEDPDPAKRGQPPLGANDGGSGTAVLVELARVLDLAAVGHTVCLAFFDAEDNGRLPGWDWALGSRHFVAHRGDVPACAAPVATVVVDMVGDPEQTIRRERHGTRALVDALWQTAGALGYGDYLRDVEGYALIDDHRPFLDAGLAAALIIDFDSASWHTTADDLDAVAPASLGRVGRTVEAWLEGGARFGG